MIKPNIVGESGHPCLIPLSYITLSFGVLHILWCTLVLHLVVNVVVCLTMQSFPKLVVNVVVHLIVGGVPKACHVELR